MRHRQQPLCLIAITDINSEYIPDREGVIGLAHETNLVARAQLSFLDNAQVSAGTQRFGKAARKKRVIHPHRQPPAGDARLGNLHHNCPDLPTFADERLMPEQGISYFVTGAGGQDVWTLRRSAATAASFDREQTFTAVEVLGSDLFFQTVSRSGITADAGVIRKRGRTSPGGER